MNTEYMIPACRCPRQMPVNRLPTEKVNKVPTLSDLFFIEGKF